MDKNQWGKFWDGREKDIEGDDDEEMSEVEVEVEVESAVVCTLRTNQVPVFGPG